MHISRPIYFDDQAPPPSSRSTPRLAIAVFALLSIVGPIVFARLMAPPPRGDVPAFIGP